MMISSLFDRLDYPSLLQSVYLNQASLGLIGQPAVNAMHTFIENVARHGNVYMSDRDEVAYFETLRERASRLLHCESTQVAIVASASEILVSVRCVPVLIDSEVIVSFRLGGGFDGVRQSGGDIPREKLVDAVDGMIGDASQHFA